MEEIVALTILVPLAILICLIVLFARGAGQRRQLAALRDEVDALRREVRNLRADATSFSASGRDDVRDQEMPPAGDSGSTKEYSMALLMLELVVPPTLP